MSKYAVGLVYSAYYVLQIITSLMALILGKNAEFHEDEYLRNMYTFQTCYITIWAYVSKLPILFSVHFFFSSIVNTLCIFFYNPVSSLFQF